MKWVPVLPSSASVILFIEVMRARCPPSFKELTAASTFGPMLPAENWPSSIYLSKKNGKKGVNRQESPVFFSYFVITETHTLI
jgi:hypothetical protein